MLQPKQSKKLKKVIGDTGSNMALSTALTRIHPALDLGYDLYNIYNSLSEGDIKGIAANTIGALIPAVSGKAIESSIGAYIPNTPQIEKEKFKFNLNSSSGDRMKYYNKYGAGYLNNPEFIKNEMKVKIPTTNKKTKKYALGTGEKGIDPSKRKLFDESSMTSNGFADVGFNTSNKNFGLNAGVGFNPNDLYGRVGGSFNKKGFNASGEFTQRPEGNYGLNAKAGYGNENINTSLGYSNTNNGEQFTGNINAGSDKLRLIMNYLKNADEENFNTNLLHQDEVKGISGETLGTLATSFGAGFNQGEPSMSGGLDFTTKAYQNGEGFNFNAKGSYSEEQGPSVNAGVKYRFGNGTNQEGIMKKSMNPRKKYGNGSNLGGIGAPNYIETPAETMNDYNIMMAKASGEAMRNPWLPVVSIVGNLAQQAAGVAYKFKGAGTGDTGDTNASRAGDNNSRDAAMGMNNVQQDVEVEGGEMYETPQGQVGKFEGPSHAEGGIPLEVVDTPVANPNEGQAQKETKVYSQQLMLQGKTLAERKEARERKTANLEKQATQPNVDQAVKNALQRKMAGIQKEEDMDLQFQGQVENMQQMADMAVQAFAYGTSMECIQDTPIGDSMRYGYGTGSKGMKKYAIGTDDFGLLGNPPKKNFSMFPTVGMADYDTNSIKNLHDALGIVPTTEGYGTAVGPATLKAYQSFATNYMKNKGYSTANPSNFSDISRFYKNGKVSLPNKGEADALGLTTEGWKFKGPEMPSQETIDALSIAETPDKKLARQAATDAQITGQGGNYFQNYLGNTTLKGTIKPEESNLDVQAALNGTGMFAKTPEKEPSKFSKVLTKLGEVTPGVGDMTKLFGNYMSMTAGIKGAYDQRASDVTQKNSFANAGKKAQELYDQSLKNLEGQKAQALLKTNTQRRTSQKSGRNSARGINQIRAIDWLYNDAASTAANDIVNNTQAQLAQIFQAKAGASLNADQMIGTGDYQANMANMASKDAFTTALTQGRQNFATGLQQTGKDLNAMKQNNILENLLKNSGDLVGMTADGEFFAKPSKASSKKKEDTEEILMFGNKKFKKGKNNQLIEVTT